MILGDLQLPRRWARIAFLNPMKPHYGTFGQPNVSGHFRENSILALNCTISALFLLGNAWMFLTRNVKHSILPNAQKTSRVPWCTRPNVTRWDIRRSANRFRYGSANQSPNATAYQKQLVDLSKRKNVATNPLKFQREKWCINVYRLLRDQKKTLQNAVKWQINLHLPMELHHRQLIIMVLPMLVHLLQCQCKICCHRQWHQFQSSMVMKKIPMELH